MFEKTKATIKRVTNKISGRIYNMTAINSEQKGMSNKHRIKRWVNIYEGKPYWRSRKVKGDNLPAAMVSELSKKATIELTSEMLSENLDPIAESHSRLVKNSRDYIEQLLVQGSGLMVPIYLKDGEDGEDGEVDATYIPATHFNPLKFNHKDELIEVEIFELAEHKGVTYTRVETHLYDRSSRSHTVDNQLFKGDLVSLETQRTGSGVRLSEVPEFASIEETVTIPDVSRPLFVYVKTPYTNNININSKLGVSIYAKVEESLKEYDEVYTAYITELKGKKIRLDMPQEIAEGILETEPSDSVLRDIIYPVPIGGEAELVSLAANNIIGVYSPEIREEKYSAGMEKLLRQIERNAGFSYGALSEVNFVAKTATEIKIGQQTTESTVADIQLRYEEALRDIAQAMFELALYYGEVSGDFDRNVDLSINWGDSIIDGDENGVDSALLLSLVDKGLMKKEVALSKILNCSVEEALLVMPEVSEITEPAVKASNLEKTEDN